MIVSYLILAIVLAKFHTRDPMWVDLPGNQSYFVKFNSIVFPKTLDNIFPIEEFLLLRKQSLKYISTFVEICQIYIS